MLTLPHIRSTALAAGVTLGLLAAVAPTAHADLYKWTDENGIVQYSDRKPQGDGARNVERKTVRGTTVPEPVTPPAAAAAQEQPAPAETPPPSAEEQLAERDRVRAANCEQARNNLAILNGRYRVQDSNTGAYLDGDARDARLAETQADIATYC